MVVTTVVNPGYIKDFKALSEDMQKLIRTIKRVRVIFGLATLTNPVDESGKKVNDFETHSCYL